MLGAEIFCTFLLILFRICYLRLRKDINSDFLNRVSNMYCYFVDRSWNWGTRFTTTLFQLSIAELLTSHVIFIPKHYPGRYKGYGNRAPLIDVANQKIQETIYIYVCIYILCTWYVHVHIYFRFQLRSWTNLLLLWSVQQCN